MLKDCSTSVEQRLADAPEKQAGPADPKGSTGPWTADSHHYALQGMLPVIVSSVV